MRNTTNSLIAEVAAEVHCDLHSLTCDVHERQNIVPHCNSNLESEVCQLGSQAVCFEAKTCIRLRRFCHFITNLFRLVSNRICTVQTAFPVSGAKWPTVRLDMWFLCISHRWTEHANALYVLRKVWWNPLMMKSSQKQPNWVNNHHRVRTTLFDSSQVAYSYLYNSVSPFHIGAFTVRSLCRGSHWCWCCFPSKWRFHWALLLLNPELSWTLRRVLLFEQYRHLPQQITCFQSDLRST